MKKNKIIEAKNVVIKDVETVVIEEVVKPKKPNKFVKFVNNHKTEVAIAASAVVTVVATSAMNICVDYLKNR